MTQHRLLISYAHPDDESFGNGGLIAKYVAQGTAVHLLCATDGDVGTIPDHMQGQYATIRELRLAELACANQVLKFAQMHLLHYKDSGMMGSPTTDDKACLWWQWQHHPDDVLRRVVTVIRQVRPQVILTFNQYGGYGHPDHIAIQRATTQAFNLAGDPNYHTEGVSPYQPQKLYYSSLPNRLLKLYIYSMKLRGIDTTRVGANQDVNFDAIIEHVEPAHTRVAVGDYLSVWDAASACHASQGGGSMGAFRNFPMWFRRLLLGHQEFTRVYPHPAHDRIDEHDLFAGVT